MCSNCPQPHGVNLPAQPDKFQYFDDWQVFENWMFEPLTDATNDVEQEPAPDASHWSGPVAGDISKDIQGNAGLDPDKSKPPASTVNIGLNTEKEHTPTDHGNVVS
ncbi:hypothetical protein PRZ48_011050 [Zasmidium cellare]|uniref:Uncharacterized protein n=1 Tax=Zasmidium cellare TaxID=395010 RepID=A0ABR0EAC4_ZASCE|nr:hypothetical protein PRZ48_011050 [Zasmidium cellare]